MTPWPTETLSTSTTTPGGTISTMFPWPTEIARSRVGWLMTAAEKSIATLPCLASTVRRRGTTQGPSRLIVPWVIFSATRSLASAAGAGRAPGAAGRSTRRTSSSP